MRIAILPLIFVCLACESKPTRVSSPDGKVTREGGSAPRHIDLYTKLDQGPLEIESVVLTDPGIQACLKQNLPPDDRRFTLTLQGKISPKTGEIQAPLANSSNPPLNVCLSQAAAGLRLPKPDPKAKTFKLRLSTTPGPGKALPIQLEGPKKLE